MSLKGFNIEFPLKDDVTNNYFLKRTNTKLDAVKSDIYYYLLTEKGTRLYYRNFGSDLRKFLFEPNDEITWLDIENDIKVNLPKFVPGTVVNSVILLNEDSEQVNEFNNTNSLPKRNSVLVNLNCTYTKDFFKQTFDISIRF